MDTLEPKMHKMALTGNLDYQGARDFLTDTAASKMCYDDTNHLAFDRQIYVLENILHYIQIAMAFNVAPIAKMLCDMDRPTDLSVFDEPIVAPSDCIWLEELCSMKREQHLAELFVNTGIVDYNEYAATKYASEKAIPLGTEGKMIKLWCRIGFVLHQNLVLPCTSHLFFTIDRHIETCEQDGKRAFPVQVPNRAVIQMRMKKHGIPESEQYSLIHEGCLLTEAFARTLQFLSMKNIHCEARNYAIKNSRRNRQLKAGGFKYHTLVVSKPGKQYTGDKTNGTENHYMPLHLCRGHIKHYTEERPLFGKYAGRFFIPAHVRGRIESGVVAKSYSLKAN